MRNGERRVLYGKTRGELSGFAMKCHGRASAGQARNLAVAPTHAMIPACAESLHRGFLGGEARGITLKTIRFRVAVADLAWGENAVKKTLAEALDGLTDAGYFGNVDARAYDHEREVL